jgi:hypothetical protein
MEAKMKLDPRATVRALLAAAGIAPSEEEVEKMIESYPGLRAATDGLYTDEISRFAPAFLPTDEDLEQR